MNWCLYGKFYKIRRRRTHNHITFRALRAPRATNIEDFISFTILSIFGDEVTVASPRPFNRTPFLQFVLPKQDLAMFSDTHYSEWEDIVSLFNPVKGRVSCVGYAPSQGRRCQMPRNKNAVGLAYGVLAEMKPLDHGISAVTKQELYQLAGFMLCRFHCDQAMRVACDWAKEAARRLERLYEPRQYQGNGYAEAQAKCFDKLYEILQRLEKLEVNLDRKQSNRKQHSGSNPFMAGSPQAESFGSRATSNSQAPKESPRCEPDQKQKQGTGFRSKPPPPQSPPKQAAPQPRPAITPASKPAKQSEREIWDEVWSKYLAGWACLDKNPKDVDAKVPWPTKSGKLKDVSDENVRKFFWEGPSNGLKSGPEWFSVMSTETKKWHTDKIMARFGPGAAVQQHKEALDLIARVVTAVWQDSKRNRHQT